MPTEAQADAIVEDVKQRLQSRPNVPLEVSNHKLEDDWLYIIVTPSQPGVRASDHAQVMSQIERELRQQGSENVLLVPAIND